jgi:hypothetical protein
MLREVRRVAPRRSATASSRRMALPSMSNRRRQVSPPVPAVQARRLLVAVSSCSWVQLLRGARVVRLLPSRCSCCRDPRPVHRQGGPGVGWGPTHGRMLLVPLVPVFAEHACGQG